MKNKLLGTILSVAFVSVLFMSAAKGTTGYMIVPLRPLDNRNIFYGGSVIDVKFKLLNAEGNLVTDATATLLVDGAPAVGRGSFNEGDFFTIQNQNYIFKLDTSPLSAGFGSPLHTLTITASVGGTEVATASFGIALH